MKKIYVLTPEQQQFATKHHDIVKIFLSRSKLDESDFYDVVIFGFLSAVQEYLTNSHLADTYAFNTIAWRKMRDCVSEEFKYRNRTTRNAPMGEYHENFAAATLDDLLPCRMQAIAETLDNQARLMQLLSHLTPKELEIVRLKADGYTCREIADMCCITNSGVSSRFHRMRRRLAELALI